MWEQWSREKSNSAVLRYDDDDDILTSDIRPVSIFVCLLSVGEWEWEWERQMER